MFRDFKNLVAFLFFATIFMVGGSWMFVPAPAGGSFVPSDISDMVLGIDPTCTRVATQWDDCWSGNGHDVISSGADADPTTSTLNSQPVLTFDGGNTDYMQTAGNIGVSGDAAFTIVAVVKSSTTTPGFWGFSGFGNSGVAGAAAGGIWPSDVGDKLVAAFAGAKSQFSTDSLSTATKIVTITKAPGNIDANTVIRVNGADVTDTGGTAFTPNITNSHFFINTWGNANTRFRGQIGASFVFSKVLNGTEITNMETYLNGLFAAF